jgi:CheY-like chemotaxis protein
MESDHRKATWEMLLSEAHAISQRVRKRLRDLQRLYHLPERMLQELDEADDDRTDPNSVFAPSPASALASEPPTAGNEPSVSPPLRGLHPMPEIYLQCLAPAYLEAAGHNWGLAITHFPCTVGRHPECGARLDHSMISRRHCSFFLDQEQIWVEDLGSRNGTTLNGQRLYRPELIQEGDRLGLAGLPFQARLPVSQATPVLEPTALEPEAEAEGPARHVLVVEDNAGAAAALVRLLQTWGHEVRIAHNGPAALRAAQVDPPDTVLLDICLPGMDGYQVAKQLRAQPDLGRARLVAMTGYEPLEDQRFRAQPFDRLLTKPLDPEALQRLLVGR